MYIQPIWPASKKIKAFTTLRSGGISPSPYHSLNLAEHVNDTEENVLKNREILKEALKLPQEPIWITQTHSTVAVKAVCENRNAPADASYSDEVNQICAVLTADCLPILLCNKQGTEVAAIHAGWRGLLNGIIDSTLKNLHSAPEDMLAWLGPCISQLNFEVGNEVRDSFLQILAEAEFAFLPSPNQRWLADLYALARLQLVKQGVSSIYGGGFCTYAESKRFYSYRRDGSQTGRMASLIWISSGD